MPIRDNTTERHACSRRLGARDGAALAFVFIAGFAYFSSYYDDGFSITDESSVVLITKRLFEGQRPFRDVTLGYGLLWYYPLVLLYKFTGVNYVAVRIFFLALAMVTSLLAFLTIRWHTRRRWLAILFALLVVLVPGTLHKTFIPLIAVANMASLPFLDRDRSTLASGEVFAAGFIAAVSYHIRPDQGFSIAAVLIATLVAHTLSRSPGWWQKVLQLGRLSLLVLVAALVPTLPLIMVARRQGFLGNYLSTLYQPFGYLRHAAHAVKRRFLESVASFFHTEAVWAAPVQTVKSQVAKTPGGTLDRLSLAAAWEGGPHRDLAILTYLPLLVLATIVMISFLLMLSRRRQSQPVVRGETIGMLAFSGFCFSAFPQFFLFRPDSHHLSQFMPGYMALVGVFLGRWLFPDRDPIESGSDTIFLQRCARLLGRVVACILILHTGFYVWFGLHHQETGSIARARGRNERFVGANGIDMAVNPYEKQLFTAVSRIVEENTNKNDIVLCFPYCPGFNLMTNRRTFMRRLYVDDSLLVMDPEWQQRMIDRIRTERPALIIIQDWAVNGTDISRFENWATRVMDQIESEYIILESAGRFKFYRRRE